MEKKVFHFPPPQEVVWMSDRQDFWNSAQISLQTYMMSIDPIDFSHFKGKKVLFLVHGYNNTVENANQSYEFVSEKMGAFTNSEGAPVYDSVIHYFWPGYNKTALYFEAEKNAESPLLISRFAENLKQLSKEASFLDVVAHSMGNRVMMEALSYISQENVPILRYFYSFAAAIDDQSISLGGKYFEALRHCKSVYFFHSDVDIALSGYQLAKKRVAVGSDTIIELPLAPPNVQFIDCTLSLKGDHSGYFTPQGAPIFLFIENSQKTGSIASVPCQWVLLPDGRVQQGDTVLNWAEKYKFLMEAAKDRIYRS